MKRIGWLSLCLAVYASEGHVKKRTLHTGERKHHRQLSGCAIEIKRRAQEVKI
jgi:hypothetical protein